MRKLLTSLVFVFTERKDKVDFEVAKLKDNFSVKMVFFSFLGIFRYQYL